MNDLNSETMKQSRDMAGIRKVAGSGSGSIVGEVWRLPAAGFATFVAALPAPMAIGTVTLDDGTDVTGFLVEPAVIEGAEDITHHGGWRAYREQS